MNERKDGPIVENDMHFNVPGRWDNSMYPEIYGIPEPLLVSLAHTTLLANEREISAIDHAESSLSLNEYLQRAHSLEKYLCTWNAPVYLSNRHVAERANPQHQHDMIINNMIKAMHKSLLIFFYRRVYETDPMILQQYVEQVRDLLAQSSQSDIPATFLATSFVWTAFIAGSEALYPDTQTWFAEWFDEAVQTSNIKSFHIAKSTMQEVWRRRKAGIVANWPTVLRERKENIFYL